MSNTPPEFDLKFLPDWLKEGSDTKKYADYEGPRERSSDRGDRRGSGGGRPGGGFGKPGGFRPGGPGRGSPVGAPGREGRGPRPGGPGGPSRGPRRDGPPERRGERGGRREERDRDPRPVLPPPPKVKVEFLPEPGGASSIAKQIKQSGRAYPLFGTGRLFLERPERHRVRITSLDPNVPLFQYGDGPITLDQAAVERYAFVTARSEYYKEEVVEGEPIKGNFKNVARIRGGGPFLGPTSYHSYQPALRRIYEERYSRRMGFSEFTQQEVQILTDEQSINDWKEQARSTTTYVTLKEEVPLVFKTVSEVEAHFRKNYLPQLVQSGTSLECSGQASREIPERSLSFAVRDTWERERGFPVNLVNQLRPYLGDVALHYFKHKKRILYISAVKPTRYVTGQAISSGIEAILTAVEEHPRCTRRDLALRVLGTNADAPEMADAKASLARDFHYLVHAGHVIEFHDGAIDLPLLPGGQKGIGKGGREEDLADAERDAEQAALAEAQNRQGGGKRTEKPARTPAAVNQEPRHRGAMAVQPGTATTAPEEPQPAAQEQTGAETAPAGVEGQEGESTERQTSDVPSEHIADGESVNEVVVMSPDVQEPQFTATSHDVISSNSDSLAGHSGEALQPVVTTSEEANGSLAEFSDSGFADAFSLGLHGSGEGGHVLHNLSSEAAHSEESSLPSAAFFRDEEGQHAPEPAKVFHLSDQSEQSSSPVPLEPQDKV